jgi:alpha-beta hydrolase superfamily lysophospholipase
MSAPTGRYATQVSLHEERGERISIVEPAGRTPFAQVVCVHGLSDHLGRQLRGSRSLAALGYRSVSFELTGHGGRASEWADSKWVYEAYLASDDPAEIRALLQDGRRRFASSMSAVSRRQYEVLRQSDVTDHLAQIDRIIDFTSRLDPKLPVVMLGHSMGALLCVETAWRLRGRPGQLRGVILLSPALRPQGRPGNVVEGLLLNAVWGLRRAPFSLTRTAVKTALDLNLPVETSWGNRWISDLREEVALFSTDPLIPARLPTRYASSIEGQMAATERRGFRFPFEGLLLVPDEDGITGVGAGLSFARSVQGEVGSQRFQFDQFPGLCAHDLLRSSARDAAMARIGAWLGERFGGARSLGANAGGLQLTA